ncbi:MAG: hypothetical protein KF865_11710 [Bdellovibrionaceae bacterium]|nr:hypothetical protein [Pseudobdellovibrionaceae bacterium]
MILIDLELRRGLMRLSSVVNETALNRDLDAVAAIPAEQISRRERERLLVRKAISHLPQNMRLIVFLKFWEGEMLEEIAASLGLSLDRARSEYVTALSYLEKVLKPYVLEPSFFTKADAEVT